MDIWNMKKWISVIPSNVRTGLRLRFDKGVDVDVRKACIKYAKWLRTHFYFPMRIPIYFKNTNTLKTADEKGAYATFFRPDRYCVEPYIRIAVGDYKKRKTEWGKDNAIFAYLCDMTHELTHYYQMCSDLKQNDITSEKQADYYRFKILDEWLDSFE